MDVSANDMPTQEGRETPTDTALDGLFVTQVLDEEHLRSLGRRGYHRAVGLREQVLNLGEDIEFCKMMEALSRLQQTERTKPCVNVTLDLSHSITILHYYTSEAHDVRGGETHIRIANDEWRESATWSHSGSDDFRYTSYIDCTLSALELDMSVGSNGDTKIDVSMKSCLYTCAHTTPAFLVELRSDRRDGDVTPRWIEREEHHLVKHQEDTRTTATALLDVIVKMDTDNPDAHTIRCLIFLHTLFRVVVERFMTPDQKSTALGRWTGAALGVGKATESAVVPVCEAMEDLWNECSLSSDCQTCEASYQGMRPAQLIRVATWKLVPAEEWDYAAVSYSWSSVRSDDHLQNIVRTLVDQTSVEYVWIDRFCLSSDLAKKEDEIHHMSDIYGWAKLVIILPGNSISELDKLQYDANGTAINVDEGNRKRIEEQWIQSEWRGRCWTFQEASMARATAVVTGSLKKPLISGAALDALATCPPGGNVKLAPWHPLDDTWLRTGAHFYEAVQPDGRHKLFSRSHRVCGACSRPRSDPPTKQGLLELMGLTWNRVATKELDTVYSLLAMAHHGDDVPVRYNITMEDLYVFLINEKIVGADVMALGTGHAGSSVSWMPERQQQPQQGIYEALQWGEPAYTEGFDYSISIEAQKASVTSKGSLRAATVRADISVDRDGRIHLNLLGKDWQPVWIDGAYRDLGAYQPMWIDGDYHAEWQAHVLAPLTEVRHPRGCGMQWRLVLILSSGTGDIRHVERTQVLMVDKPRKTRTSSLSIEIVEFGL